MEQMACTPVCSLLLCLIKKIKGLEVVLREEDEKKKKHNKLTKSVTRIKTSSRVPCVFGETATHPVFLYDKHVFYINNILCLA